jgi:hypothetical protein
LAARSISAFDAALGIIIEKDHEMAKGRMFAFSNPSSPDREAEYNIWYDGIHGEEVTALPGVGNMKRYRAVTQMHPPSDGPAHNYIAVYELDDIETALQAFGKAAATFNMSDAMDLENALVLVYEDISLPSE